MALIILSTLEQFAVWQMGKGYPGSEGDSGEDRWGSDPARLGLAPKSWTRGDNKQEIKVKL